MKRLLQVLFLAIMLGVIGVNVWAGRQLSVFDSWPGFEANPWAMATLLDAYCAFLAFYVWVAWRERTWSMRAVWFVLIMGLGSITISLYMLIALARLKPGEPVRNLFFPPAGDRAGRAV